MAKKQGINRISNLFKRGEKMSSKTEAHQFNQKWSKIDMDRKYRYFTGRIETGKAWKAMDWDNHMIDPMNLTLITDEPKKDPLLCFDYVNLNKEKQQLLAELMKEPPLSELIFDLIINRIKEIHKLLRDDHEGRQV